MNPILKLRKELSLTVQSFFFGTNMAPTKFSQTSARAPSANVFQTERGKTTLTPKQKWSMWEWLFLGKLKAHKKLTAQLGFILAEGFGFCDE